MPESAFRPAPAPSGAISWREGSDYTRSDALVKALQAKGDMNVTAVHPDTDHAWSDHRTFLEAQVINWLATLHAH